MARYTGFVLDEASRRNLLNVFAELVRGLEHVGFTQRNAQGEALCHHMTINLGNARPEDRAHLNQPVMLVVDGYGVSEKAVALRVKSWSVPVQCKNANPHITLLVHPGNGGKPKDSDAISEWMAVTTMTVQGTMMEV